MPIHGEQAQFEPLLRVGKVHQYGHRVHHALFGGAIEQVQKRQTGHDVGQVDKGDQVEIVTPKGKVNYKIVDIA